MTELDLQNHIAYGHVAIRVERDKRRYADSRLLEPFIRDARTLLTYNTEGGGSVRAGGAPGGRTLFRPVPPWGLPY